MGIYGLLRFFYSGELLLGAKSISSIILGLGVISMLIGVLLALLATDTKRILAFSSISQMGYILLGLGTGTTLGLAGGIYHIINHSLFKGLLFLCIGAVLHSTGERNLVNLGGLGKKMPLIAVTSLVASFSISGIPPFNGFISKGLLLKSISGVPWLNFVFTLTCAGTIAVFLKLYSHIFLGTLPERLSRQVQIKKIPLLMLIPLLILSLVCVLLGVLPGLVLGKLIFPTIGREIHFFSGKEHYINTIITIIAGFLIYLLSARTGLLFGKERLQCLTLNKFYSRLASVFVKTSTGIKMLDHQDLSTYLLWALIFLVVLLVIIC